MPFQKGHKGWKSQLWSQHVLSAPACRCFSLEQKQRRACKAYWTALCPKQRQTGGMLLIMQSSCRFLCVERRNSLPGLFQSWCKMFHFLLSLRHAGVVHLLNTTPSHTLCYSFAMCWHFAGMRQSLLPAQASACAGIALFLLSTAQ